MQASGCPLTGGGQLGKPRNALLTALTSFQLGERTIALRCDHQKTSSWGSKRWGDGKLGSDGKKCHKGFMNYLQDLTILYTCWQQYCVTKVPAMLRQTLSSSWLGFSELSAGNQPSVVRMKVNVCTHSFRASSTCCWASSISLNILSSQLKWLSEQYNQWIK